jgi:hypothetical protein
MRNDGKGASNTVDTIWADHHSKFGWRVDDIYPSGTDGTHINSVTMSKDDVLIAAADDYGLVNIYRNPVRPNKTNKHLARSYRGHSEFV